MGILVVLFALFFQCTESFQLTCCVRERVVYHDGPPEKMSCLQFAQAYISGILFFSDQREHDAYARALVFKPAKASGLCCSERACNLDA
jgi:hypothetical protein